MSNQQIIGTFIMLPGLLAAGFLLVEDPRGNRLARRAVFTLAILVGLALVLTGCNQSYSFTPQTPQPVTPQITIVQLCPGTPTYPSTFPEDAECIDNALYAVYSANDGFLTELTPGLYQSNAIGSSCTFTVAANCVVTH